MIVSEYLAEARHKEDDHAVVARCAAGSRDMRLHYVRLDHLLERAAFQQHDDTPIQGHSPLERFKDTYSLHTDPLNNP